MGLRKLLEYNLAQKLYDKYNPIKSAVRYAYQEVRFPVDYPDDYMFHVNREAKAFKWGNSVTENKSHLSFWILNLYNVFFIFNVYVLDNENIITIFCQWTLFILFFYHVWKGYEYTKHKKLMDKL